MSLHCNICLLNFQDNNAFQGHLGGKKHFKKVQQAEIIERSIVVSPLPKWIQGRQFINFFQRHGKIKQHKIGPDYLIIEFCDSKSAEALLKTPVWLHNKKLNIKRRTPQDDQREPKSTKQNSPIETEGQISYNNIKQIFKSKTTFDNQLAVFLNTIQLTDEEIEERYDPICTKLNMMFKVVFPRCTTYKFGSTQTGLSFKNCDLDIYVDIGEPIYEAEHELRDVWTMSKIFRVVKKMLYRKNYVFSNIVLIPRAKTPIIKFCYVKTDVSCDISFKNMLGIYKTYLIKHCISLDSRLKPLMMLIKYWARHFKISGTGRISNFALVLIIIFYLQQPSVNIIPPLMKLQETCNPQVINGWQANFDENATLPPITNKNSIPQLLHGFFLFYASFTFKSQVICTLDGMTRAESEFENFESLPEYMHRYKEYARHPDNIKLNTNRPICVQDPIELSHNITACTPYLLLGTFTRYCAIGSEICATTSKDGYRDLLDTLFGTVLPKKPPKNKFIITISANRFQQVNKSNDSKTNAAENSKFTQRDWYFIVFNIVKDIFEKVFKLQVEVLTADVEAKQQKIEMLSDVHTGKYEKLVLHCIGSHCVWRNRKIISVVFDTSLSSLEKETLISEKVIENCGKTSETNGIKLDFICTFEKKTDLQKVFLTINIKDCDDNVFQEFTCFAKNKLPEIVERTLIHMQQFDKWY
ncbi:terminal uridylyltransferase Tailor-like [Hylaeus volcanicus]|uniref:terminal uridylyltransferase Tailor-like n=1 Tax=Hylaeus volcanicus TaxID=313075 RepID=UPI0023B7CC15|nr:terminal uridylyltransferase Tailor-like [Hylaeus volcanicus]